MSRTDFEVRTAGLTKYAVVRALDERDAASVYARTDKLRRLSRYDQRGRPHQATKGGWYRFVTTDGTRQRLLARKAQGAYDADDPRRLPRKSRRR